MLAVAPSPDRLVSVLPAQPNSSQSPPNSSGQGQGLCRRPALPPGPPKGPLSPVNHQSSLLTTSRVRVAGAFWCCPSHFPNVWEGYTWEMVCRTPVRSATPGHTMPPGDSVCPAQPPLTTTLAPTADCHRNKGPRTPGISWAPLDEDTKRSILTPPSLRSQAVAKHVVSTATTLPTLFSFCRNSQ